MWSNAREIAAGDVVIIWQTRDAIIPVTISSGQVYNSKFGCYPHDNLIGTPYGSKVHSKTGRGFVHVLRPTPELWTLALPHRTQILYAADIAFIVGWLAIGAGSTVIEAGTGSGSFSHSVARTIGKKGKLYSYEFHEGRAQKAREEFTRHGIDDIITLNHRNVCKDGFTIGDTADSVFLDLPAPWLAVDFAKKALRKDRIARICCFSPCMEQVLRTVTALNAAGFTEITMFETLTRPHDIYQQGSCLSLPTTVSEVGDKLKKAEVRREEKRLKQVAAAKAVWSSKEKVGAEGEENDSMEVTGSEPAAGPSSGLHAKRKRGSDPNNKSDDELPGSSALEAKRVKTQAELQAEETQQEESALDKAKPPMVVSRVLTEVRGHTSYLTFACLVPLHPDAKPMVLFGGNSSAEPSGTGTPVG